MLDLDSLHKIRDIKIKEISSMKKPKKPKFTHTSREFLKVFAFGILFMLFFLIKMRVWDFIISNNLTQFQNSIPLVFFF